MLGMLMPSILKMRYEICWSGSGDCSAALASPRTASSSFSALAATRFAASARAASFAAPAAARFAASARTAASADLAAARFAASNSTAKCHGCCALIEQHPCTIVIIMKTPRR